MEDMKQTKKLLTFYLSLKTEDKNVF